MKTSQLFSALLLCAACTSASAGIMTVYENATPLTINTNSNNAIAAQTIATTSNDLLVNLTFQFSGLIGGNDFLALWFGNDVSGTGNDKNISGDHTTGPNIGIKGNGGGSLNPNPLDLFVRNTGSTGSWLTGSAIEPGVTYQLFGHLYMAGGSTTYNRFDAWLNPTADEMMTLTGADATSTNNSGISALNAFGFRSANLDIGDSVLISNVRIQVIPEPNTLLLAGLSLFGLAGFASRRSKKSA